MPTIILNNVTIRPAAKAFELAAKLNRDAAEDGSEAWNYNAERISNDGRYVVRVCDETGFFLGYL